eukprot:4783363-Prymnesium_polylepis.1
MRSLLGTRIELCYLFVRISFGSTRQLWPSARQVCSVAPSPEHSSRVRYRTPIAEQRPCRSV